MYNTYFSSTIYAVRCKDPFSLSFNGYSNIWYERYDRTPSHCSSCCSCCDCCALSIYRVPITPCLLNGLRQSTLLQLSASRRFILGRDQYFSRLPASGLHRGCYDLSSSVNEKTVCNKNRRRIEGKCVCAGAASQKDWENHRSPGSDDAEAVLSLLTEESDKDAIGFNWKNASSSKRTETERKRKNVNSERKKAETEKKGNLKQHLASTRNLRREDEKPSRERQAFTKSDGHRKRRDVSSCSSYYSLSSGDFGSDLEVQDRHGLEELSAGYEKDEANHVEVQVKEEFNRHKHNSEKLQNVSKQEKTGFGADIDWNLRKKSEKKLAEVIVDETKSTKDHQDMHSRAFKTHEASYGKASLLHKQVGSEEDNSSFVKDQNAYIQTGNRKLQYTDIQDSGVDEIETALLSQKAFTGRQGKLERSDVILKETGDEHKKIVGSTSTTGKETSKSKKTLSGRQGNLEISEMHLQETRGEHKKYSGSTSITGKDITNRSSQKYIRNSQIEDTERTLNTAMKNLGEKHVSVLSSGEGLVEEQQHQQGEKMLLKREVMTQTRGRRKSQQVSEVSEVHESNVEDTSIIKSRTKIKNSEDHLSLRSDARATWQQTDERTAQSIQLKKGSELVSTSSEGYTNDEKQLSSSTIKQLSSSTSEKYIRNSQIEDTDRTSNTAMKNLGAKQVLALSSAQGVEEKQQHQQGEKMLLKREVMTETKERRKSQQFSEVSQVHESNVEDTSIRKSRTKIKNSEDNLNLSSDARATWQQTDKRTAQSIQLEKVSELVSTSSEGYTSDEKQVSSSKRTAEKVKFIPKSKSMAVVKTRESSCQTDESIVNFELAIEDKKTRNVSLSDETASREEYSFRGSVNSVSKAGKHFILAENDERRSAIMLVPSSSQSMGGGSAHVEVTAGIVSPGIVLETSESGSSANYDNSGISPALLSGQYSRDGSDQAYGGPSIIIGPEDSIGSADRLEKSSNQFVDEFVERVRHEVTTSETQEMEVTRTKLAYEDEGNKIYNLRDQVTQNDSQSKEHDPSRSSGHPGTKGPSDEIWDVKEPSVEQSLIAEETEIRKETEKPIVSRTGRSLWSMIADVVRFRWASRAGSSTSAERSGERNSPNKSDSEAWFSGQEHEETHKSNVIKETSVLPQAMTSDKLKPSKHYTRSKGEMSDTKRIKDKGKHLEVGSQSSNTLESGSVVSSYASEEANIGWTEDGKDTKFNTSGIKNMELPFALPARGPPIVGEIAHIGGLDLSRMESVVPIKEPVTPVQFELSDSGSKDGELTQRKFQRNKQVLRDRFDEWEEAYQLELEQRRMDESFMKEALLEAQKAAEMWEVPVGAVLVQQGKIIARGCNLVEELRDSTAHAEIICIREASNFLRTWRLSDTTLYVTLEPCPMCAGAILQARVDSVVWGAPNKLLGADGSWIRLFPEGGNNVSESSNIPPAPVHPFHPNMKVRRGVLANECADMMQQFFQLRRKKKEEPAKDLAVTHHHSKFLTKIHDIFHVMFCL